MHNMLTEVNSLTLK